MLLHIGTFNVIYYDGLARGLASGLRFFIILCSAAIMAKENTRRVISSLNKMHIPYSFSFMVMIAFRITSYNVCYTKLLRNTGVNRKTD